MNKKSKLKTEKNPNAEKVSIEKAKNRLMRRKSRLAKDKFVFLDLETGGLNDEQIGNKEGRFYYPILQIAVILTNEKYEEITEPLNIIIKQDKETLDKCSEWTKETFKDTLMKDCLNSEISLKEAEEKVIELLIDNNIKEKEAYLAGNSIRLDRDFITTQMYNLNNYLHYRQLDLTSIRIFLNNIFGENLGVKKEETHDALTDIRETIQEAKVYQSLIRK